MKAYIINLERSTERKAHILKEAANCGLDFEIIDAVDGSKLNEADIISACNMEAVNKYPDWLTNGAIGCILSHRKALEKIANGNDDIGLILEDDAVLPSNLSTLLSAISEQVTGKEVVQLFYMNLEPLIFSTQGKLSLPDKYELMLPMLLDRLVSAVAYVITREAARSLYEKHWPIEFTADSWGHFYNSKYVDRVWCVYPMPVDHLGIKSTISSTSQGMLRAKITSFIDDFNIPILKGILKKLRQRNIARNRNYSFTDSRSSLERK